MRTAKATKAIFQRINRSSWPNYTGSLALCQGFHKIPAEPTGGTDNSKGRPMRICGVFLASMMASLTAWGAAARVPWWEAETAMSTKGEVLLRDKPWWPRAQALKVGEQFLVRSALPGGGQMLVRRERLRRGRKTFEAVVWVLDDDGDFRPGDTDGDKDSDCYVADYGGDGRADRMVDYIDNDGDGTPDEMDIRYFHGGGLRRAWFGMDLDGDGHMWSLGNYEYAGGFFRSDPYGNNMIYFNAYDAERDQWLPGSECPFAFYDTDGDNQSEAVVRVSAVPLGFDPLRHPDYANGVHLCSRPFTDETRKLGAVNIRYGIDIDGLSSAERPLHHDMGFNLIGRLPYQFPGMEHTNPLRRHPKTTRVCPHGYVRQMAETYPADQTGFSWHEHGDDGVTLGFGPHARDDRRWEGIFWTWSRRIMHNTGGPIQIWNMRREFRPTPSARRVLYYSRVDRRIHLEGATEGWTRVGRIGNRAALGELRCFDTDADGRFDRWETHLAGKPLPVRVSTVRDAGLREVPQEWDKLREVYTKELLPEALAANGRLIAAMQAAVAFQPPEHLAKALGAAPSDSERRYVQDIIRELHYLALRAYLLTRSKEWLDAGAPDAWDLACTVALVDAAYGEGRYGDAVRFLRRLNQPPDAALRPVRVKVNPATPPTTTAVGVETTEFLPPSSRKRDFYTCRADRRVHLKGASSGRVRFSAPRGGKPWGETRYFDTDGDGYFDRWETYRPGQAAPTRVSTARDPGIRALPSDPDALGKLCAKELLPEALDARAKLMAAMRQLDAFVVPEHLASALKAAATDLERREVQGLICEQQFLSLRDKLARRSAGLLEAFAPKRLGPEGRKHMDGSARAWALARTLSHLDAAYGEGRHDHAIRLLAEWAKLDPGRQVAVPH